MRAVVDRQLKKLTVTELMRLRGGVAELSACCPGSVLRIGTGCSGTDVVVGVASLLMDTWSHTFGSTCTVKHNMACENVPFKQQFIVQHWKPDVVFADLLELDGAVAQDMNGAKVRVPDVDFWCCAFECDSVSQLSKHSKDNRSCVSAGSGRTGSTAQGHLKFVQSKRPPFWIAENVKNLHTKDPVTQESNLDSLIRSANKLGYYVTTASVDAANFGLPQRRPRYYIMGVRVGTSAIVDQFEENHSPPVWSSRILSMMEVLQIDPLPWSVFLSTAPPDAQSAETGVPPRLAKRRKLLAHAGVPQVLPGFLRGLYHNDR